MPDELYVVEYNLRGKARSFVIRHPKMSDEEAWHWASCDAGLGVIPRFGEAKKMNKVPKPTAQRYGIEDVRWRRSA